MWALIQNGSVSEITDIDPQGRFHPSLDWVACDGSVQAGHLYQDGVFSAPETILTPDEIEAQKIVLVQAHLDASARALRYDSIASAITYAEEPAVPKFQHEGQAFRAWRSLVWAKCYAILDEVNDGKRPIPTDEELIGELPELVV